MSSVASFPPSPGLTISLPVFMFLKNQYHLTGHMLFIHSLKKILSSFFVATSLSWSLAEEHDFNKIITLRIMTAILKMIVLEPYPA